MAERRDSSRGQGPPSDEKPHTLETNHLEHFLQAGLSHDDAAFLHEFPPAAHKKAFRKVDWRLMPMLMALYLIANLDRANLGNAKIEGLEADLNMKGTDYNIANMMFFVPYILLEVPSNAILIKFTKPSQWISLIVTGWGIVMTCCGLVQSWGGLVGCRVLLGVFEAGFFPGAVFLLSQWYPPYMTQLRMSLLYCAAAMSGAFSGLLAAAIAKMSGVGGYKAGAGSSCSRASSPSPSESQPTLFYPTRPPIPSAELEVRYLNLLHEKFRDTRRHEEDLQRSPEQDDEEEAEDAMNKTQKWKILVSVLTDWQIYLQAMIFMSSSIMVNMGFSSTQAQLLSAPPYIAGAISAVVSSTFADRVTWRLPFIVGPQLSLMTAYAVLFSFSADIASHVALCFTFVHVATTSVYPIIPGGNTWTVNNLAGQAKRAMGVTYMIALGNCGGIIGSFIFIEDESPRYQTGWGVSLGFVSAGICAASTLEVSISGSTRRETNGDRSPLFHYAL
ncbi:hypothetical protein BDV12DRAFT_199576 [Aspergillus spectabilis]